MEMWPTKQSFIKYCCSAVLFMIDIEQGMHILRNQRGAFIINSLLDDAYSGFPHSLV